MLIERLGLKVPVLQAPMAGVSTPRLAAAVSDAGALGSLGIGAMTVSAARDAIRQTRQLTRCPFGVNVFCHVSVPLPPEEAADWLHWLEPEFERFDARPPETLRQIYPSFLDGTAVLDMLLEERPACVSFHFGLPDMAAVRSLRAAGIMLLASVTSVREAELAEQAGMDVLIAQGYEAGGHRGVFDPSAPDAQADTKTLLATLKSVSGRPLIAAGGLMTGRDVVQMLDAGAVAGQLGTAFVACDESAASPAYRAALKDGDRVGTAMITAISGRPARGLRQKFQALADHPGCPQVPPYPYAYDAAKQLDAAARARDESGYGAFWAGTGVASVRPMPAARLVETLRGEIVGTG
ncbi:NAD(P)H-dependent flavin oxidoreductase [Acetobacter sp.]|jgi:nitronate monooxygenase|uniref:NAD(P)H-dependent flavin oxidoreductase n=1 Tax=Acetobacter sp. TaxID=440 RepID=UPI0025B91B7D|nr:nitronate monooxygenase [Acetobacter sp.]MCH4092594.1 nitronate monooxygenase [Acetobacter sp.]MCI1299728.1 nitronate monooxygenase [Acetobacter sp.]MCI1315392.1 nitronate monooxygenase [Acetobacter sp.]